MRTLIIGGMAIALLIAGALGIKTRITESSVPVGPYEADVNKNGIVNSTDLLLVAKQFGLTAPSPTPDPSIAPITFSGMSCSNNRLTGTVNVPRRFACIVSPPYSSMAPRPRP